MDSLVVPNASSTTAGNLWRSKSCAKNYYAASQHTGNIRKEYNFLRFRQPCLKHVYKDNEERFTYQECNRKFVVTATSGQSFETNPNGLNLKSNLESVKRFLNTFAAFCSPFALIGIALSITSTSFLGVEKLSDISPLFAIGVLQAIIPKMFLTIYINGLNQICDVEIDKINKPDRPLVSGALSFANGVTIIVSCLIMSLGLGLMVGSWPSLLVLFLTFILWSAYSVNLPLLRWKKYPALTGVCYLGTWAFIFPILYRLHIQTFVLKRPATFSRPVLFSVVIMGFFSLVLAYFKDIYDIEGDRACGIQTIAVRLGKKKGIGHVTLASILLYRARSTDLENKDSIMSFYMLIWKV